MKIPLTWVKQYVDFQETPEVIADMMTMAGVEVGNIETIGEKWQDHLVLCGKIVSIDPHPNADRLQLPTVDIGGGVLIRVVCGAPNIVVGQLIAFAKSGSILVNLKTGLHETLKPANIRGIESNGMVCSAVELGVEGDHDGILVLAGDHEPGTPLRKILGDSIMEIELTPNRPDCLSIMGNAYEIGALTNNPVNHPKLDYQSEGELTNKLISVNIEDNSLCSRYTGLCITGISVKPSPQWMQDILIKNGQRPINNIVDITNYVMLEIGQPLHAFDMHAISGQIITVRKAHLNEKLVTLDKQEHPLQSPMLVIADKKEPIGLAGIMGGIGSQVNTQTKEIFLEAANFDSANIRATRTTLGLNTEASYRFERNLRPELAPIGLKRAAFLINNLAEGKVSKEIIDLYPGKQAPQPIMLSEKRIERVIGSKFSIEKIWDTLQSLGFQESDPPDQLVVVDYADTAIQTLSDNTYMWVIPPYWRSDIEIEDDLVEEFARIYGYNNLPSTTLSPDISQAEYYPELTLRESLRNNLVAASMVECINYSVSEYEALSITGSLDGIESPVVIANPMDSTKKHLRTSLRANLLRTLSQNRTQSYEPGIRLFEIGHVFSKKSANGPDNLPNELENVVGLISGPRESESLWAQDNQQMDFYDLKGVLEYCFEDLSGNLIFENSEKEGFEPGNIAVVHFNGTEIGWIGQTSNQVDDYFDIEQQKVFLFELNLDAIYERSSLKTKTFNRPSKFPSSFRDISVIGKDSVTASQITQLLMSNKLVTVAYILDTYRDEEIGQGKVSLTVRIIFQSIERTLKASEIDKTQKTLFDLLDKKLGVKQRFVA